jgi:hypothetical protein
MAYWAAMQAPTIRASVVGASSARPLLKYMSLYFNNKAHYSWVLQRVQPEEFCRWRQHHNCEIGWLNELQASRAWPAREHSIDHCCDID